MEARLLSVIRCQKPDEVDGPRPVPRRALACPLSVALLIAVALAGGVERRLPVGVVTAGLVSLEVGLLLGVEVLLVPAAGAAGMLLRGWRVDGWWVLTEVGGAAECRATCQAPMVITRTAAICPPTAGGVLVTCSWKPRAPTATALAGSPIVIAGSERASGPAW